jgi:uncharacterized membrane protein
MILLALGVLLFGLVHLIPAFPVAKERIKKRLGEKAYGPVFGALSIIPLVLIVVGWRMSPFIPVYEPPENGRYINFVLTALAFIALGVFIFRGKLRQILRFPLAIGVILWAMGHLFANGDLASVILFGGLLIYGLVHLLAGLANGLRPSPEVRNGHDMLAILIGLALYGVMTQLHPIFAGVPILVLTG